MDDENDVYLEPPNPFIGSCWYTVPPPPVELAVHGKCITAGLDMFGHQELVKWICDDCPVKAACRSYGLEHKTLAGVWGGLSEADRRGLRGVRRHRPGRSKARNRNVTIGS